MVYDDEYDDDGDYDHDDGDEGKIMNFTITRFSRVHLTTSHPISFGSHAAYIGLPQVFFSSLLADFYIGLPQVFSS